MDYIPLGKTQSSVSKISLGTWSYGGAATSGEQSVGWADQDDTDSRKALLKAHALGINHWDTADVYGDGRSEKIIGDVLKNTNEKIYFTSNIHHFWFILECSFSCTAL